MNSYAREPMISFFFQEIQPLICPVSFPRAIYCTSSVFLILLYNFLYYILFIVHIIFYTTVYCTLWHFFKLSSYVSPKANSVHHSSFTLLVFSRFTVVYSDCWKELEMDSSQVAVNGIISNTYYALCTKYITYSTYIWPHPRGEFLALSEHYKAALRKAKKSEMHLCQLASQIHSIKYFPQMFHVKHLVILCFPIQSLIL